MNDAIFTDEPPPKSPDLFTDEPLPSSGPPFDPEGINKEKFGPGLQDVSVPDSLAVQGVVGLAKLGGGLAMRGMGALMDAIPTTENITETIGRIADNQMLKSTGGSMGQIRQIGTEAARDAAKVGREAGLGDVFSTEVGRGKALADLDKTTGAKIGTLREEAGNAPLGIPEKVAAEVAPKYAPGTLREGEAGGVEKALNTVKQHGGEGPLNFPTHAGYAKAATELNDFAAGNKLYQPTTAATDVANKLSAVNNAGIAQSLGSEKAAEYVDALSDEKAYKVLEQFFNRGELREMASRGGAKGILQQIVQGIADKGGYRVTSKFMNALHEALTSAPKLTNPLSKAEAINEYLKNQFQKQ